MKFNFLVPLAVLILFLSSCSTSQKTTTVQEPVTSTTVVKTPVRYRASDTKMHDLIHTRIEVSFDWKNQRMPGSATLTLKPHFYPTNSLFLDARGMEIQEVKIVKGDKSESLVYAYRNDSICITLDKSYTARDTFKVFVKYVSRPEELPKGGSAAITSDKGLYFINADGSDPYKPQQVWTQGETEANSVWFPTIDSPNQKSTEEIYFTVDTAFVTLSNGTLVSSIVNASNGTRTDYWRQSLPHAPYLFMMAVGKYAVVKDSWRGKEVSYYVEPAYEKYARDIFGHTPEMIEFFSKLLGVDYVWDKYSQVVVRDYVSGAMENTTATVLGEYVQKDSRGLLDGSNEETISHELFHQWFGDLVTCESWSNLPLNESFANYGEYLWNEYKYGRDEADHSLNVDMNVYFREARNKQVNMVRFEYENQDHMFDSHSYAKGERILHMLRKYTGDTAFFASLKLYLEKNKFKTVEIHDLRLAFEEVTGEDMNWFFNQWFLAKGHPSLKIDYAYDAVAKKELVTVQQSQNFETTPLYQIPVDIDFYTSGSVIRKRITVTKSNEVFEFEMNAQPEVVNFDAQKMLLCIKTDNHTNAEWIALYKRAPLYMDRFEALSKIMKSYDSNSPEASAVKQALDDAHWNLRVQAIRNCKTLINADQEGMKQKLMAMASKDPKSDVRDEALQILSEVYAKDLDVNNLMRSAVHDSSYVVMETAILHILENNLPEGLALIQKMEPDRNENIMEMISGFYKTYGGDEQFDYMTEVMLEANGYTKYTAVQNYGKYIMRCTPAYASKGVDKIAALGGNYPQWVVRLSAVQTLSAIATSYGKKSVSQTDNQIAKPDNTVLTDREEIENSNVRKKAEALMNDIKSKEQDLNLLKIYNKTP